MFNICTHKNLITSMDIDIMLIGFFMLKHDEANIFSNFNPSSEQQKKSQEKNLLGSLVICFTGIYFKCSVYLFCQNYLE